MELRGVIIHRTQKGSRSGGPPNCRNEYEYGRYWIVGNAWVYRDGLLHEVRDPTEDEARNIDGGGAESRLRGVRGIRLCGSFGGRPKYAEFPTGEGAKGHLDMEKSTEWAKQSAVGLIADTRRGSSDRKKGAQKMSTVGVEFGLLMIFGRSREAITFEEGYQWVICE